MKRVIVIGGSGMLGSALVRYLSSQSNVTVYASFWTSKPDLEIDRGRWFMFRNGSSLPPSIDVDQDTWIVNAAGMIPHRFASGGDWSDAEAAILANSLLPCRLAEVSSKTGCRVLQIATDCVFSGNKGGYVETDPHDELGLYGRSKSLGEVQAERMTLLRCSIVGTEVEGSRRLGLLEWFLGRPVGAEVQGYTNHHWNGVTTLEFAKVVWALVCNPELAWSGVQHLVPGDSATKHGLLTHFAKAFGREDIQIEPVQADRFVDRRLWNEGGERKEINRRLWKLAGHELPPTVEEMVFDLAKAQKREESVR